MLLRTLLLHEPYHHPSFCHIKWKIYLLNSYTLPFPNSSYSNHCSSLCLWSWQLYCMEVLSGCLIWFSVMLSRLTHVSAYCSGVFCCEIDDDPLCVRPCLACPVICWWVLVLLSCLALSAAVKVDKQISCWDLGIIIWYLNLKGLVC